MQVPSNNKQESKLSREDKMARLAVINNILSNIGMAGMKKYSDKIEDHSDKDINALIDERAQLESELEIPTN